MLLEVCTNSIASALSAEKGGADRIELCDNISEGGTTPSYGAIYQSRKLLSIDIHVLIRPRGGDFLYNSHEIEIIKKDIAECQRIGINGVVFGMLTQEGKIDKSLCHHLVELAYPMKTTFHRAFDMSDNPFINLEDIINCGFDNLLTSGFKNKAIDGMELINSLIKTAKGRINIIPGSGINETNIAEIAKGTQAKSFHVSARMPIKSKMIFEKEGISMGGNSQIPEYENKITDEHIIKKIKQILLDLY